MIGGMTTKGYIKVTNPGKIFFTSDTHFGHTRILEYCGRPFPDITSHDTALKTLWNEVVPEDGVVYHLGDFAFLGAEKYRGLLRELHGRKILILGNHDHRTIKRDAWSEIYAQVLLKLSGQEVYLSHFPFRSWGGPGIWNLHGHLHSGPGNILGLPGQLDVGVDGHSYRPWTWDEVVEEINKKEGKSLIS